MPIRLMDREKIRMFRNAQLEVLRQNKAISKIEQDEYFQHVIKKSFSSHRPKMILFSIFYDSEFIGYGGFVHINWEAKTAEISFLTEPKRAKNLSLYRQDFSSFLKIISKIASDHVRLQYITTETFDIRTNTIKILKNFGFKQTQKLKRRVLINGKLHDSLLHRFRIQS